MVEISTSVLNIERGKEVETIMGLEKAKTDYLHIDVMDGKFVEKNTYEKMIAIADYSKRISNLNLDVHLMIEDVKKGIHDFSAVEPNIITFHLEACMNEKEVMENIECIKNVHSKVGISIKPNTRVEEIYKYLPYIHLVLVMTVEPGRGGQTLLRDMIDKISTLKKYIEDNSLEIDIEADGGINLTTCDQVKNAGANMLVAGTAILAAKNYADIIEELKK